MNYGEFGLPVRSIVIAAKKTNKEVIWMQHGIVLEWELNFNYYPSEILDKSLKINSDFIEYLPVCDKYLVWGEWLKEILINSGYPKERIYTLGSHSHDYLVDLNEHEFLKDINESIKIFEEKLGYNPIFFSYPFGEYSNFIKNYISQNFEFSFGQHSGVIDVNKNSFELPRFPINEKYGDIKRFKFLFRRGRINCSLNNDGIWRWFGIQFSVKTD